ncbi:MAG: protein-methionine-sulfoxide reductase catalytic subunit MsrP, partial [Gammaproteobacteria bacterium]
MPKFKIPAINSSEITPEPVYRARRRFMQGLGGAGIAGGLLTASPGLLAATLAPGKPLKDITASDFSTDEELTPYKDITTYNNFYEFGTAKSDPARYSKDFKPRPWSVSIAGECDKPGDYNLEDFVKPHSLEERIYRLRCVEAWSMVIPWIGIPLGEVLKRFKPNSKAKYVAFTTVYRPEEMPGQRRSVLRWPYTEGLRIDEAMHPLTILAVGLYDELLPNQNGAPLRLVVPWKYGFKSIKSIVKIEFTETQPA